MQIKTTYGWQVVTTYLLVLAFVIWIGMKNALGASNTPLNDHLRAKRITHMNFKPSDETLAEAS